MDIDHDQAEFKCCFKNWMKLQQEDLKNLTEAIDKDVDHARLRLLVETCVKHYEEYHETRMVYAPSIAPSFFSPNWCSSFENSHLWIAGCRPSLFIRLVYTLCGTAIESQLDEFLQGVRRGNLGELSGVQLALIDELQCKTIRDEDMLSSRMASMQETMADQTMVMLVCKPGMQLSMLDSEVNLVIEAHMLPLGRMMEEADKLRIKTLKELILILTPFQVVELLVAAKKLHLSLHEWCNKRNPQAAIRIEHPSHSNFTS